MFVCKKNDDKIVASNGNEIGWQKNKLQLCKCKVPWTTTKIPRQWTRNHVPTGGINAEEKHGCTICINRACAERTGLRRHWVANLFRQLAQQSCLKPLKKQNMIQLKFHNQRTQAARGRTCCFVVTTPEPKFIVWIVGPHTYRSNTKQTRTMLITRVGCFPFTMIQG